jgi:hypothetical protein
MAYEGETIRITAKVFDYDGDAIVPVEVTSAVINLYDGAGNYVFMDEVLTYHDVDPETPEPYWFYDWQQTRTGKWIGQCVFTGVNYQVFEYVTVTIKARKVIPTGVPVA